MSFYIADLIAILRRKHSGVFITFWESNWKANDLHLGVELVGGKLCMHHEDGRLALDAATGMPN